MCSMLRDPCRPFWDQKIAGKPRNPARNLPQLSLREPVASATPECNLADQEFDQFITRDHGPTVTRLARLGKRPLRSVLEMKGTDFHLAKRRIPAGGLGPV